MWSKTVGDMEDKGDKGDKGTRKALPPNQLPELKIGGERRRKILILRKSTSFQVSSSSFWSLGNELSIVKAKTPELFKQPDKCIFYTWKILFVIFN